MTRTDEIRENLRENRTPLDIKSDAIYLLSRIDTLEKALDRSILAIDDWLNVYASELCNEDRVAQAKSRIAKYGAVGYVAEVQKQNREALAEEKK